MHVGIFYPLAKSHFVVGFYNISKIDGIAEKNLPDPSLTCTL